MHIAAIAVLLIATAQAVSSGQYRTPTSYNLQSFDVDLSKSAGRMRQLIKSTQLPAEPEYPGVGSSFGIDLDVLKSLRHEWLDSFDWDEKQDAINSFNHFTAEIEGLVVHFIHEKSSDPNAIPIILNHGWPGSFLEFAPIIKNLTKPAQTATGKPVAFDVIVPSLPGYAFSSAPSANWTFEDTARVFHTLMTDVLGYEKFAVHGTDLGGPVAYGIYNNYNASVRAGHFISVPYFPLLPEDYAARNISLTPLEQFEVQLTQEWATTGFAYFSEHATKPNTIGLALYDNPVGQLAWMGEKFLIWTDPNIFNETSPVWRDVILQSVSLYFLTKSFVSSVYMYAQNSNLFTSTYPKANTDAPLLFSAFKHNPVAYAKGIIEHLGTLVLYRNHDFGGHFPGLDSPSTLLADLREIGTYWV